VFPAGTSCPPAVVNEFQLTSTVPLAGVPLALYTVSCTVVVVTWAAAMLTHPATIATSAASSVNPRLVPLIAPPTSPLS
jgi:hypothetical protein